jgi:hypothetical protein
VLYKPLVTTRGSVGEITIRAYIDRVVVAEVYGIVARSGQEPHRRGLIRLHLPIPTCLGRMS